MKRVCFFLLIFSLLLPLFGCSKETPDSTTYPYTEYPEPVFTPGTLESDLLTAEYGNYDRANQTGGASFLETQTGYFYLKDSCLYYAERDNMNQWVPVCSDPDCGHTSKACSATVDSGAYFSDNRIYFLAETKSHPQLYQTDAFGYMLCSMALDGTDVRLEHIWEESLISGGGANYCVFPDGYAVTAMHLSSDGSCTSELYWFDTNTERKVHEMVEENTAIHITMSAAQMLSIRGDNAIATTMIEGISFNNCLAVPGESGLIGVDVEEISGRGGYLADNILRCYRPNDGYYDVDLLTGKEIKLADAQSKNGVANILQPNCILESDLLSDGFRLATSDYQESETIRATAGSHTLSFFDGNEWHNVTIPDEIQNLADDKTLNAVALTAEGVMFTAEVDGELRFYRMALDAEEYKLEHCGTFNAA